MADQVILNKQILTDIGNAIRAKLGITGAIPTTQMASKISNISGSGEGGLVIRSAQLSNDAAIPTTGHVDTVYFNMDAEPADIAHALSQLSEDGAILFMGVYTNALGEDDIAMLAVFGGDMGSFILCLPSANQLGTLDEATMLLDPNLCPFVFTTDAEALAIFEQHGRTNGWAPGFSGQVQFNCANATYDEGAAAAAEALKGIISISPNFTTSYQTEDVLSGNYTKIDSVTVTTVAPTLNLIDFITSNRAFPTTVKTSATYYGAEWRTLRSNAADNVLKSFFNNVDTPDEYLMWFFGDRWFPTRHTKLTDCFNMAFTLKKMPYINSYNVTDFFQMFLDHQSIIQIPFLETNSATTLEFFLKNCRTIEKVHLSYLSETVSCASAFYNCYKLKTLVIDEMPTIPVYNNTLYGCYHMDGSFHETYNPNSDKDGCIYVPDAQVEALKAATGWSAFADIIYPLSSYYHADDIRGQWEIPATVNTKPDNNFYFLYEHDGTIYNSLEFWEVDGVSSIRGRTQSSSNEYSVDDIDGVINILHNIEDIERGEELLAWLQTHATRINS